MENFIGQLLLVSFNFPPKGWAFCNGQLLPINQNQALFSLLGTTYGGNGTSTFGLPNLQGRVAISSGSNSFGSYVLGQIAGVDTVQLTTQQMPLHTHSLGVGPVAGTLSSPVSNSFAGIPAGGAFSASADGTMDASAITSAGGSQAHDNHMPYLTLNWIIALSGIFPTRN